MIPVFRSREIIRRRKNSNGSMSRETISDPVNSRVGSIEVIGGLSKGSATTFAILPLQMHSLSPPTVARLMHGKGAAERAGVEEGQRASRTGGNSRAWRPRTRNSFDSVEGPNFLSKTYPDARITMLYYRCACLDAALKTG